MAKKEMYGGEINMCIYAHKKGGKEGPAAVAVTQLFGEILVLYVCFFSLFTQQSKPFLLCCLCVCGQKREHGDWMDGGSHSINQVLCVYVSMCLFSIHLSLLCFTIFHFRCCFRFHF